MPRQKFPSDKQDQYMVRFPDGMRDHLKAAAEENNRSLNAEIIFRLTEFDRLTAAIAKTEAMLVKREEELFSDRVRLREIAKMEEPLPALLEQKQKEVDDLRQRLADAQEITAHLRLQTDSMEQLKSDFDLVKRAMLAFGQAIEDAADGETERLDALFRAARENRSQE